MKKRIVSLVLVLLLFTLIAPLSLAIDDVTLSNISDGLDLSFFDGTGILLQPEAVSGEYVYDWGSILTQSQRQELDQTAKEISETYACGVYIVTVRDYTQYGSSPREAAKAIYREQGFGLGDGQDGILLMLSMINRKFQVITYGYATVAFTDYGLEILAEKFVDNFKRDDWSGGFSDYLSQCGAMLSQSRAGSPLDVNNKGIHGFVRDLRNWLGTGGLLAVIVVLPCVIALFSCSSEKRKLKSVHTATEASFFAVPDSLQLQISEDTFSHVTQTRVRIESDSNRGGGGGGGGSSVDSDGFGGIGGSF